MERRILVVSFMVSLLTALLLVACGNIGKYKSGDRLTQATAFAGHTAAITSLAFSPDSHSGRQYRSQWWLEWKGDAMGCFQRHRGVYIVQSSN